MTTSVHAPTDARADYSHQSIPQICQAIAQFALSPPDTTYQHAYLATLKQILFRKLSDEYREARDRCVPTVTPSLEKIK